YRGEGCGDCGGGDTRPFATLACKDFAGVNQILALPIPVRLAAMFVVGLCAGTLMIVARERLTDPLHKGPYTGRRGREWLPLVGWRRWSQRVTSSKTATGRRRHLLVELTLGGLFSALYWWEIDQYAFVSPPLPIGMIPDAALQGIMHGQLLSHLL